MQETTAARNEWMVVENNMRFESKNTRSAA